MDDENTVKAPVTRRRGRLSVEQADDAKSSSAPGTPTKKRGGRRVAKPELDLIDENSPENDTLKRLTKKATVKELEVDEKPATPSRRSTRIKSNTSLILDTTQTTDSPRAKRAARRNSQVGSDNEAPLTPARATRRARKDSANTEKVSAEQLPANKSILPITEVIVEEPETSSQNSQNSSEKSVELSQLPTPLRKSPRLSLNRNKKYDSMDRDDKEKGNSLKLQNKSRDSKEFNEKEIDQSDEHNNSNKENEVSENKALHDNMSAIVELVDISNNLIPLEERLSISNIELIQKMTMEPKKEDKNLNKSSSALDNNQSQCFKYNRHRTKSWTAVTDSVKNDSKCYSDSESIKNGKNIQLNNSNNVDDQKVLKSIKKKINLSTSKTGKSVSHTSLQEVDNDSVHSPNSNQKSLSPPKNLTITELFSKKPSIDMKTLVFIEESDSNSENNTVQKDVKDENSKVETQLETQETSPKQDNVQNILNSSTGIEENVNFNKNDSCEPMDVDETIPDINIAEKSLLKTMDMTENKRSSKNEELSCSSEKDQSAKSLHLSITEVLDKTANENKSTIVLSQQDISNENSVSKSPEIVTEKNNNQTLNITQDNKIGKKDVSSNYLTSTPLQQKCVIRHAMQVNTSGIISNNTSNIETNCSKTEVSIMKKSNNQLEKSKSGDEASDEESNFVDDEAEDAGDDYESGDSRDDDEKQYEKEHEIIEKGETLTSEEELSNDSDYEKDSFVVTSDEEDKDLLDGSGDDLSMSDNELKMTAKSKNKYNERMMKEQKKASREMFESRHKIKVSNKSHTSDLPKIKKNRTISDSSDTGDEDIQVKKKKNRRMRLDSSHEISTNKSSKNKSKNPLNSSSSSEHDEDPTNEVEMTIVEDGPKRDIDPLTIDIKTEPKTPQKGAGNASIQFIDPEHSENKVSNTNKSHLNTILTDDPLEESNASESSDSSNNVHIENYDSILNDLNKSMKTNKTKKGDISLNIDKKPKQKSAPIVDQLNLTQIKKKNQNKVMAANSKNQSNDDSQKKPKNEDSDNESSASIDLHLLFSEDSNNSEDVVIKEKESKEMAEDDSYIPLKKSDGKTNILDTSGSKNKSLTQIGNKLKKKSKALDELDNEIEKSANEPEINFFLDTTGTHNSTAVDNSFNVSSAKKKKEKNIEIVDSGSDTPMEVSNKSLKEAQEHQIIVEEFTNTSLAALNKSVTKTPKSDKKKKRQKSLTIEQTDTSVVDIKEDTGNKVDVKDTSINKSVSKTPKSEKKKLKRMLESQIDKNLDLDAPVEISNKSSIETAQHKANMDEVLDTDSMAINKSITKTPKSEKKKRTESLSKKQADNTENQPETVDNVETTEIQSGAANKSINKSLSKTPKSEQKKSKRKSESQAEDEKDCQILSADSTNTLNILLDSEENTEERENTEDQPLNKSALKATKSEKKKKRLSESQAEIQLVNETATHNEQHLLNSSNKQKSPNTEAIVPVTNKALNKTSSTEKKKSKKISESNDASDMGNDADIQEVVGTMKRKRKSSLKQTEKETESEEPIPQNTPELNVNTSGVAISQNKKRKISHKAKDSDNVNQAPLQNTSIEKQQDQDIDKQRISTQNQIKNKRDVSDTILDIKKGTKKRKEREDDEGNKIAKVVKVDNNEKMQVPRLPASILNQLEDKAIKKVRQVKKPRAISTTNFVVEESKVRKSKPSHYLEESIYLNEDEVLESKKQKHIKNPKVLPSLPTVTTSYSGYTTNFKVNVIPREFHFVAKSTNISNYKSDYLENKKIKRLGTYDLYKRNRNIKMSKF